VRPAGVLDDQILNAEIAHAHGPPNAIAGSTDTARWNPVALAIKPITTAITGNATKAYAGTMTFIGNSGPRAIDSTAPTRAASSAITTACMASPAAMFRVGTPIALNTAKSRRRSSAEREMTDPTTSAATIHSM